MMKRKVAKLMAALMLLTCITLPTMGWGQVQSVAPANGNNYVVAAYVNNKYYALPCTTTNGSTIAGVEITLNSLNMVNTSDASGKTWTLEEGTGTNAGQYYFKYTSGSNTYYLYKNGTGGSNYNFKVSTSSKNYWSFTTNGKGYTVAAVDRGSNNVNIQCNNGTFRCYSSATAIILLEVGDVPSSGYIVTYNGNGATSGTVPTDNTEYENGATVTVLGNTGNLAQTGYTFGGWNTQSDGQGTNYTAGQTFQISDHTTLYAKWTINTHNVTMPAANQYGSYTASATSNVAYGTTVTLTYAPATGYENYAATWSMNGNAIEGNTFTMPDQDVAISVSVAEASEATFVFNTDAGLQALGITKPSTGAGTNLTPGTDYVSGIVTMNATHGNTETRVWNSSGNTTLRVYQNGSLTFSVPTGFEITQIVFTGSANGFGLSNNIWNGTAAQSVTLSATAQCTIQTITVEYSQNGTIVASPTLPASTTFVGSKEVTITNNEEGATIRYTIDGSDPTANTGIVYSAPFTIFSTTTVKAIAVLGNETSTIASATYTRLYTVNLTQTAGGTISASPTQAAAGETITLTATPNVGYSFGQWNITPATTMVSNNTFTMPESDVTVSATFTTTTAYTISFSVNNKTEMTATVNGGTSIDLTKFIAEGDGYTFEGWSTTAGGENITPQNAYTPSADITLYPGVNPAPTGDEYTLVTDVDQLVAGNKVVIAANGDKNIAMAATQGNNNRGEATIIKTGNTISFPDSPIDDNPCELILGNIVDGENTYWTFYDANVYNHTAYQNQGYLYAASSSSNLLRTQETNNDNGKWTISISGDESEATIKAQGNNTRNTLKYNSNSNCFSCYSSGQQTVLLYTKPASKSIKVNRDAVPTTSKVTAIAADVLVTVKKNGIVYLTGNNAGNAANLVVEDGGQLVTSANVAGTMLKHINGYSAEKDNYYLISHPLASNANPENVLNMLSNEYDLYYFKQNAVDQVEGEDVLLEWRNYHNDSFNMFVGSGYLYANSEDVDLEFAGQLRKNENETYDKNITYVDGYRFSGWNLVGNPFPSNASVNMPFYKMKSSRDGINGTAVVSGSVIAPMEGVFVIAANSNAQQQVTFTATTDPVGSPAKNNVNIDVNRDNEFLDRAIVNFNGCTLSKLNLSENTTKVYFQQGQEEFAIVAADNEGELPVNFKASRNGRYTMNINVEDLDMNYLHLIDNKTGNDVDLLATPSYTFEASNNDYESRFRLVFNANAIEENDTEANTTFAFFNGSEWVINNPSTGSGDNATLQVIDMMGRVLSSETLNGNANVTLNQPAGIYMLRLVNGENVKVQKVVVR